MLVKKYGNRRLYDTNASRYITLEELAAHVRAGEDVEVVDAKSGRDLTQPTLAHVILESRGASKLLPVPLLTQLIRMGDDALAEFFGLYMGGALELYLAARSGAEAFTPAGLARLPMAATNAFAGLLHGLAPRSTDRGPADRDTAAEVAALRRELDALKEALFEVAESRAEASREPEPEG